MQRKLISEAIGSAIDGAVTEHLSGISQEPQISSRIGQILENEIDGKSIFDANIRIITQDFPDRGPNSLEKAVGADLYVGITMRSGTEVVSKGFLVQAKITDRLTSSRDFSGMHSDCTKMLKRSPSSYVWLYEKGGVRVLDAKSAEHAQSVRPGNIKRRRLSSMFERVLQCSEGDVDIGLRAHSTSRSEVRQIMQQQLEEMRVAKGLGIEIQT